MKIGSGRDRVSQNLCDDNLLLLFLCGEAFIFTGVSDVVDDRRHLGRSERIQSRIRMNAFEPLVAHIVDISPTS